MSKTQWINCKNDKERIATNYSNYEIKDFWDWWSDGHSRVMEIRIKKNYKLINHISKELKIPSYSGGVFVKSAEELKKVIYYTRKNNTTIWYCPQPKKKNYCEQSYKNSFHINNKDKRYAGDDHHVDEISFLFIDIDRIVKNSRCATNEELTQSYNTADIIIKRFEEQGWKDYCLICSGNGVQLIIKLDVSIKIPECEFNIDKELFIENNEYLSYKELIRNGIGKQIKTLIDKQKEVLKCEIDNSVFKLSIPAAIPNSKNFKYKDEVDGYRWRGIVYMNKDNTIKNIGLSDYCLQYLENIKEFKKSNLFINTTKSISEDKKIKKGELFNNPVVCLFLYNDFPSGGINNTLWFQLKCLLRDSNFDLKSEEFIDFYRKIRLRHKRDFSLNYPKDRFSFNEDVVNSYCIQHLIPPPYPAFFNRICKRDDKLKLYVFDEVKKKDIYYYINKEILDKNKTIMQNIYKAKEDIQLINKKRVDLIKNIDKYMLIFLKKFYNTYGEETFEYYYKYVFDRFFNRE